MKSFPAEISIRHSDTTSTVITSEEDGFLGQYESGNFIMDILPKEGNYYVLREDKERILEPIKRQSLTDRGRNLYRKQIAILSSKDGASVTKWPGNHVKLLYVYNKEGSFSIEIWEAAIVAQVPQAGKTNFFFTTQLTYDTPVFRNEFGSVITPNFPGYTQWPSLQEFINEMLPIAELPETRARQPKTNNIKLPKNGQSNIGYVLWYNLAYQIGAIATRDDIVRVHWSQLELDQRFKALRDGQKVKIRETIPAVNTYKWPRVTNFDRDAIGICSIHNKD